jgi:hypothetical protein
MVTFSFFRTLVLLLAVIVATALLALTNLPGRSAQAQVAPIPKATLVGAGDIASCSYNRDYKTAIVVNNAIANASAPVTIFTLGDNAYPDGSEAQFRDCYDPTWGGSHLGQRTDLTSSLYNPQMWNLTRLPVVGNHEYRTPGASAYFDYFGARASDRSKGYYSYDVGSWHVVVLNSNCDQVGGCGWFSAQGRWLRADLASNPASCTVASFHHPLYTSSVADTTTVRPFWDMLYGAGADVILSGHAHYYERFAPLRPNGTLDKTYGIREFIAGTGGQSPDSPMRLPRADYSKKDSEKSPGVTAYGILKLDLYESSYAWEFLPIEGETFTDSGSGQCHGKPQ